MSATLGNLVDNNHGLRIFCDACSRESEVDVDQLLALYGRDLTLPEVGRKAKCRECGHKGGTVQVISVR